MSYKVCPPPTTLLPLLPPLLPPHSPKLRGEGLASKVYPPPTSRAPSPFPKTLSTSIIPPFSIEFNPSLSALLSPSPLNMVASPVPLNDECATDWPTTRPKNRQKRTNARISLGGTSKPPKGSRTALTP